MVQLKDMSVCASEIQYLEMYDDTQQQQQRIPELEGIVLMDSLNTDLHAALTVMSMVVIHN
jgi:hypothetical protein